MSDSKKPAPTGYSSPYAKLAMSTAMGKAAKRNQDPRLADRAEELRAEAYEELRATAQNPKPTLN